MTTYYDSIFTALNNLLTINADDITTSNLNVSNETSMNNATVKNLTVIDSLLFPLNYMWSNLINQNPLLTGTNHLVSTNFNNNITQSFGSNQLLDTTIGSITQSDSSVIIQYGNQWNQLKQTQVSDLSITGTLTLPPNIVISGSSYNDDLIMNNATIQQSAPPDKINTFGATDFYNGDIRLNKNLTMIGGADTIASLKNLNVEGNSNMGLIISPTITNLDSRITTNTNNITTINTNMLLKADLSYVNSQLALKLNSSNPSVIGTLSFNNTTGQKIFYFTGSNVFTSSATSLENTLVRYNTSNSAQHVFSVGNSTSNGYTNIMSAGNSGLTVNLPTSLQALNATTGFFSGAITSPTITNINNNKADKTYVDTQLLLKDNIVDVDNKLLLKDNIVDVDNKLLLKDNIIDVDAKVLNLQNQIDDIIASEYYESISIGTITTLEPDQPAYVINSGTNINAILDFGIPRGYTGNKGDTGDTGNRGPKGETGDRGPSGSDGAPGDSTAATISAGIAATAATASATSSANASASATASAISASSANASATLATTKVQELEVKVGQLDLEIGNLDTEVSQVQTKTQYISVGGSITSINSTLNTNEINANSLYVANSITVIDEIKASKFSGGLLSTQIGGSNINIGTNETLINTINIGSASTITTINGAVIFSNPFNNAFFSQW